MGVEMGCLEAFSFSWQHGISTKINSLLSSKNIRLNNKQIITFSCEELIHDTV